MIRSRPGRGRVPEVRAHHDGRSSIRQVPGSCRVASIHAGRAPDKCQLVATVKTLHLCKCQLVATAKTLHLCTRPRARPE
jgi:hypothetical protein